MHRVIKFNQKASSTPCIRMNTELRKKADNDFEKRLFLVEKQCGFGKTKENVRKHRNIRLAATEEGRTDLVIEPNLSYNKRFFQKVF